MAACLDDEEFQDEAADDDEAERKLWKEPSREELLKKVKKQPDIYKRGKDFYIIYNILILI